MAEALYRKYRSKGFDEIVGQESVVSALKNAVQSQKISHAYLFTGPRGTGKTSVARILAHAINNIPYSLDQLPIDIIEIDAASNRGIEEIRDLRERVRIAPISAAYKVYIIDEVHMLTTPAFNALLKTLEEPPAHVVFILATTESHKLPETIVSRTQRYSFKLASQSDVAAHLQQIAKKEDIAIDDAALLIIAEHSGGSLRDALSLLDHVRHLHNNITADILRQSIGIPSRELVDDVLDGIKNNNPQRIVQTLEAATASNVSASALASAIVAALNNELKQSRAELELYRVTSLLDSLIRVDSSQNPDVALTVALLSAIEAPHAAKPSHNPVKSAPAPTKTTSAVAEPKASYTSQPKTPPPPEPQPDSTPQEATAAPINNQPKAKSPKPQPESTSVFTPDAWPAILEDIRASYNTLYSVLRMANIELSESEESKITLVFSFAFHQKRINDVKNKEIIITTLATHGYTGYQLDCIVRKTTPPKEQSTPISTPPKTDEELTNVLNVFGSAEVLE